MPGKHMPITDADFSTIDVVADAGRHAAAARAQAELIEILARLVLASVEHEAGGHGRGGGQAQQHRGPARGAPRKP
jgi:hypothetical protein